MSSGATARLFVALDPPASVREALAAWARAASSALQPAATRGAGGAVRLLDADSLHLTLCFLGSRPVADVVALARAFAGLPEREPPELSLGAPVWLPPRRPRALAVEVHDADLHADPHAGALAQLQEAVTRAIAEAIAWQPERRRFRGHVTVARARSGPRGARPAALSDARLPPTPQRSFKPARVALYRSWLAPTGATYELLAEEVLRGSSS